MSLQQCAQIRDWHTSGLQDEALPLEGPLLGAAAITKVSKVEGSFASCFGDEACTVCLLKNDQTACNTVQESYADSQLPCRTFKGLSVRAAWGDDIVWSPAKVTHNKKAAEGVWAPLSWHK